MVSADDWNEGSFSILIYGGNCQPKDDMSLYAPLSCADWHRLDLHLDALLDLDEPERSRLFRHIEASSPEEASLLRAWLAGMEKASRDPLAALLNG